MTTMLADQAWFWKEAWQTREREVDEQVSSGHVDVHESTESFLAHLDAFVTAG